jgi:anti-sigma factor ChrR (cupin superfamily)
MKPREIQATAAEYLLGLLEPEEAETFRRQLENDTALQTSLGSAGETLSILAESLPPAVPSPRVKARFLETINSGSRSRLPRPPHGAVRAHEGKWRATEFPGITYKVLYIDKAAGLVTTMVRMEPGASFPAHRHSRPEQCVVIEGDLIHDGHIYGPGDFTWADAGSIDPALETKSGNLLLIIGAPETEKVG